MILPARNLWDTRIQCVVGIVLVYERGETDLWLCANFGQLSFDPPRLIINPSRLYAAEGMIRRAGRFSLNILPQEQREAAVRLMRLRRREPDKVSRVGWSVRMEASGVPVLAQAIESLVCEVDDILETGDHTVMIARVISSQKNPALRGKPPLLYHTILGSENVFWRAVQGLLRASGALTVLRSVRQRVLPPPPANLPEETYWRGGQTEAEIAQILSYGATDRGKILAVPGVIHAPQRAIGVCVVGTHWGVSHYLALRKASPLARLFLCGREEQRTAQLARKLGADGYFVGLAAALRDPRVEAVTLALPPHLHREATETALAAGRHVLVEKPIANTLDDADRMIDLARRHGQLLMVAENMHFRPTLRVVEERVRAGDAGEPVQMVALTGARRITDGWAADREELGGGVFIDIGIHYVRAMRLLVGEPDQVIAFRPMQVNTKMAAEDGLTAHFTSHYGWHCQILTTWAGTLGIAPDIILIGDRGTFHLWPLRGYFDYYPSSSGLLTALLSYVRPYRLQKILRRPELQRERTRLGIEDTGYREEMAAFLAAVAKGQPCVASAQDARRDLEIVQCAYRSMESGRVENIPPSERLTAQTRTD
jgi:predicted dehydrogenase/flavin reductase (DIM6/NTAB) family NADH-FMN oxidoreductase RutF